MAGVTIPDSVTSLGEGAFQGCNFTRVTIPDGITSIEYNVFFECRSLTSVSIPNSVTSIGGAAFWDCRSLFSVTIPNRVTSIGDAAFDWCSSLTSVTIPSTVTSIGYEAFGNCIALKDVYYSGTKSQWDKIKIETGGEGNDYLLKATIHYNSTGSEPASYTVTFNANSGTVTPKTATVTNGQTYGTLPAPTRTGYKFDGWYTTKTGGTKVTSTTKVTKTTNHTLYAHWSKVRTFSVTLNANGGTVLDEYISVTTGARYRHLPTPTRASYHFDGWYTKSSGGTKVTEVTKVSNAVTTLYARWTKTNPTVKERRTAGYQIIIPEDYKVLLYNSETTASVAKNAVAQTSDYTVTCTKMVKLSNGTVRYYGIFPKVSKTTSYWFTYSDEMFIN